VWLDQWSVGSLTGYLGKIGGLEVDGISTPWAPPEVESRV